MTRDNGDDRPDLVLIMTDQQRFDRGVIFDAAYSASTVCVPARTTARRPT